MISPKVLIIGTKFWGHDSSVFMVMPQERKIAAIQTERVTRYKHDKMFATPALITLIEREGIDTGGVEEVVFCNSFASHEEMHLPENLYEIESLFRKHFKSPYQKDVQLAKARFDALSRLAQVWDLLSSTAGWGVLLQKALLAVHIKKTLPLPAIERTLLHKLFPNAQIDIRFYEHEFSHIASTAVTSPFTEATVISMDGWGDEHFSNVYSYQDGKLALITKSPKKFIPEEITFFEAYLPSVGGIYMYFTKQLGFVPEQDEGKVEALAAYGKPVPELLAALISVVTTDNDLSLCIDTKAFAKRFAPEQFAKLLEVHTKEDLSATVQAFLEKVMLEYCTKVVEKTGKKNIAFAGGIAANVINNLGIYENLTQHIHITPAMGDDGSAQGAAFAYLLERGMDVSWIKENEMPYYETAYTKEEVKEVLQKSKDIVFEDMGELWPERTAQLVADGKIGAIFHGRAEWGPRALGHRSIIAETTRKDFRDIINKTIKRRPLFQPFCPSMLAEERTRLFESAYLNKHMTTAFRLKKEFWDLLPSAMHVDGTARVQFVEEKDDANYFRLLKKVKELTGYGVIINTSFNKHGRTIVESPQDAIQDFLDTDMEYLVIEGLLVKRK